MSGPDWWTPEMETRYWQQKEGGNVSEPIPGDYDAAVAMFSFMLMTEAFGFDPRDALTVLLATYLNEAEREEMRKLLRAMRAGNEGTRLSAADAFALAQVAKFNVQEGT